MGRMIEIRVILIDSEKAEQAENLNIQLDGLYCETTLYIRRKSIHGFFVSHSHDFNIDVITLFTAVGDFCVPYSKEMSDKLKTILYERKNSRTDPIEKQGLKARGDS